MCSPALPLRENDVTLDWSVLVEIVTVSGANENPWKKAQIILTLKNVLFLKKHTQSQNPLIDEGPVVLFLCLKSFHIS